MSPDGLVSQAEKIQIVIQNSDE